MRPRLPRFLLLGLALTGCVARAPAPGSATMPGPAPVSPAAGTSVGEARPTAQPTAPAPLPEPAVAPKPAVPPPLAKVNCASTGERGQLALSAEQYELRTGKDARTLAELRSSRARPVEVCGVHDQHALLMQLTCADGSRPVTTTTDARRARVGSVGPGGRCGTIIDLYRITCPTRRHDVYMDAYFCRADLSLDRANHPPAATSDGTATDQDATP